MKILTILLLLILPFNLFAQNKILGRYRDYFGDCIQLNIDSTFEYTWHFDLSGSWTKGTWKIKQDTILFYMIPIYDTVSNTDNDKNSAFKLILSDDTVSERFTYKQLTSRGLSSVQQNLQPFPKKLFYKHGRLYEVKNGRLIKKREKDIYGKKFPPWLIKSEE